MLRKIDCKTSKLVIKSITDFFPSKAFILINEMLLRFFFSFRENIKHIVKLLASIRALDHATSVASDHNVKEFKSLIEGK